MDEPDVPPRCGERLQMKASARRIDTGFECELALCGLEDGSWSLRVPEGPVVVLDRAVAVLVARSILGFARSGSIRWAASSRDPEFTAHAVDESKHPRMAMTAECGARLAGVYRLYDRPVGPPCPDCVAKQRARARPVSPGPDHG